MSDPGRESIAVIPPKRGRWMRRELWFVLAALVAIALVAAYEVRRSGRHAASGAPIGTVPAPVATPVARPSTSTPG